MNVNFDAPAVELSYVKARETFRLVVSDESDGFSADPGDRFAVTPFTWPSIASFQ